MTTWTPEEQKAHRKLWVEALRSGKYRQATGRLRDFDGAMCCLGVACDISRLGAWGTDGEYYAVGEHISRLGLPSEVRDWLGLSAGRSEYAEGDFASADKFAPGKNGLSGVNDSGAPFSTIADIIESEPEGLIVAQPVVV